MTNATSHNDVSRNRSITDRAFGVGRLSESDRPRTELLQNTAIRRQHESMLSTNDHHTSYCRLTNKQTTIIIIIIMPSTAKVKDMPSKVQARLAVKLKKPLKDVQCFAFLIARINACPIFLVLFGLRSTVSTCRRLMVAKCCSMNR